MATQTLQKKKKTYRNLSKLRQTLHLQCESAAAQSRAPYKAAHTQKRPSHPAQHTCRSTLSTLALPHKVTDASPHTSRVLRTCWRQKRQLQMNITGARSKPCSTPPGAAV